MTPDAIDGPPARGPVVELDPSATWPRRIAAMIWLPVIVVALLIDNAPAVQPVWLLPVGLLPATAGWVVLSLRVIRPRRLVVGGVLALTLGGGLLLYGAGTWTAAAAFPMLGAHLAGIRMPPRASGWLAALVAATMIAAIAPYPSLWDPVLIAVAVLAVMLLGMVRRDAARRTQEREQTLVADARARAEHARAEAIAERARIARDVHDVLAHSLSALAVQLQGARLMAQRDGAAADTIAQIERAQRLATDGLTEARRAVRALREGPDGEVPDVAAGLRALVADHPGATSEIDPVGPLEARAGETVLRTAQEALSNVRKHAPGAAVHVRLRSGDAGTDLEVTDVTGVPPAAPADGGGYGLVGMGERAALVGATLDAGPTSDGWRVALHLPSNGTAEDRA